ITGAPALILDDLGPHCTYNNNSKQVCLPDLASFRADELALIQFTAGRSGPPRATPFTHAALSAAADAMLGQTLRVGAGDRVLSWIPLHQGLIGAVIAPLRRRVPCIVARPDPLDARRWLQLVDRLGATITYAGGATLEQPMRPDPTLNL